jgi:hypothetical protein
MRANVAAAGPVRASSSNATTLLVVQQEKLVICPCSTLFIVPGGRRDERGEMRCKIHPYVNAVGVCASCLRPPAPRPVATAAVPAGAAATAAEACPAPARMAAPPPAPASGGCWGVVHALRLAVRGRQVRVQRR